MNASVLLKKILMELSASRKLKFEQQTLDNGTILEAEAFANGNEVFIVTDEERIPLPVGSYVLSDGRELIVEEEGLIASVSETAEVVEAEEEVVDETKIEAEEETVEVEVPEEVAPAIEEIISAVVEVVAPMIEEVKEEMAKIREEMGQYKEKMSKTPAGSPIKHNPAKPDMPKIETFAKNRAKSTIDRVLERMNK
jgi:hypothetical protein